MGAGRSQGSDIRVLTPDDLDAARRLLGDPLAGPHEVTEDLLARALASGLVMGPTARPLTGLVGVLPPRPAGRTAPARPSIPEHPVPVQQVPGPPGVPTGSSGHGTTSAWGRVEADRAARRRWLDLDPHVGRLLGPVVAGGTATSPDAVHLVRAAARAAPALDLRRLDARLRRQDPLVDVLVSEGWMAGSAGGRAVCSTLVELPWRRADPHAAHPSRLVRSLRRLRGGRIPGLAAMGAEEVVGTLRTGAGTNGRARGAADLVERWNGYEAVRHRTVRRQLALVPARLRRTAFVDLGCGRGRPLQWAARLPFSRLVGVERDAALAAEARRLVADPRLEVVEADLTTWRVPDDVGVVHLFNPVEGDDLFDVVAQLEATIARRPRPLLVLLTNPRDLAPWAGPAWRIVHGDPQTAVVATAGP